MSRAATDTVGGELPTGDDKARLVTSMFDRIAPRYDLVNRIMTFGLDVRWRRRCVRELALPPGSVVADLACGTGDFCGDLTRAGHVAIGADMSGGMLAANRTGAPLVRSDVTRMPLSDASVDGATCGFALRNIVDLDAFLAETHRVVRPGGRVALLEVCQPASATVRRVHGFYFGTVVPRIGALLSDGAAYAYLPRSVEYLPAPDELVERVRAAGFGSVEHRRLTFGAAQAITATRI
ncbi:MAG: ubiquinone/menaquinone biosynthesis methyltransferase [Acidimicrobiales bacterium]